MFFFCTWDGACQIGGPGDLTPKKSFHPHNELKFQPLRHTSLSRLLTFEHCRIKMGSPNVPLFYPVLCPLLSRTGLRCPLRTRSWVWGASLACKSDLRQGLYVSWSSCQIPPKMTPTVAVFDKSVSQKRRCFVQMHHGRMFQRQKHTRQNVDIRKFPIRSTTKLLLNLLTDQYFFPLSVKKLMNFFAQRNASCMGPESVKTRAQHASFLDTVRREFI